MTFHPSRIRSLFASVLLALGLLGGAAAMATSASAAGPSTTEVGRVNQERAQHGLPALERSRHLTRVARAQAARMADRSLLFHNPHLTEPDATQHLGQIELSSLQLRALADR